MPKKKERKMVVEMQKDVSFPLYRPFSVDGSLIPIVQRVLHALGIHWGAVDIWHYADEMVGALRHTYLHESSPQLFQMGKSWGLPMVVDVNKWMLATYFSDDSSHLPSFFSIFILLSSLVWFS